MSLIVVIEDHIQNARMVEKLLTRAGHKVLVANDGETGLTMIFENEPDIALVDLGLPDIDGQTVVALVRQQPNLQDMPLVVFTAWPEETALEMTEKYGCNGIISKPIDTALFAKQVEGYIPTQKPVEVESNGDKKAVPVKTNGIHSVATSDTSCPNHDCADYGKVDDNHLIRYGKTKGGEQRFQCKTCQKTFSVQNPLTPENNKA